MANLTIRDDALWAAHIGDSALKQRVREMPAGAPLRLVVDGRPILFRKMKDGADGRPTPGLRADDEEPGNREAWALLQARRGEVVPLRVADLPGEPDPYLVYLDGFLSEWNSPEDAAAFDGL